MKMRFQASFTLAFAIIASSKVCAQDNNNSSNQSILQILQTNSETSQLYSTFQKSSATNSWGFLDGSDNGTYTVFAPANSAFTPQVIALLPTINNFNDIFRYHVVNGSYPTTSFQDGSTIVDTIASNGTILKWSNATGLPIKVLKNSSSIQIFSGFSNATVVKSDIKAKNGIVHLINIVLNYPQSPSATIRSSTTYDPKLLSQFYGALDRIGILDNLDNSNGLTIFAPNDEAFADIDMVSMDNDTLSSLIKYHIVNNVYYSTNLTNLTQPLTVSSFNNTSLNLTKSGDTIELTNGTADAKVVLADVLTNNGVIHIINKVLYPPNNTYNSILTGNNNTNVTGNSTNNGTNPNGSHNGAPSSTQLSHAAVLLSLVAIVLTLFI